MNVKRLGNRSRHLPQVARVIIIVAALSFFSGPIFAQDEEVLLEETEVTVTSDTDVDWVRVYGEGIGNDIISVVGFIDAIDISSRSDVEICFPLLAKTLFLDADTDPREISHLEFEQDEDDKTTCATVSDNGTVVLATSGAHRRLTLGEGLEDTAELTGGVAGGVAGGIKGTALGAAAGGAVGTIALPGVGTVSGAMVGGVAGGTVGGMAGTAAGSWIGGKLVQGGFFLYDLAGDLIDGDYPCLITPADYYYVRDEPWGDVVAIVTPETTVYPIALWLDEGGGIWFQVFGSPHDDGTDVGIFYIYARWVEKKGHCI